MSCVFDVELWVRIASVREIVNWRNKIEGQKKLYGCDPLH